MGYCQNHCNFEQLNYQTLKWFNLVPVSNIKKSWIDKLSHGKILLPSLINNLRKYVVEMKSKGYDCGQVTCRNIYTHKTIIKRKLSSKYAINDEKIEI